MPLPSIAAVKDPGCGSDHALTCQAFQLGCGEPEPIAVDFAIMRPQLRSNPARFTRRPAQPRRQRGYLELPAGRKWHFLVHGTLAIVFIVKHFGSGVDRPGWNIGCREDADRFRSRAPRRPPGNRLVNFVDMARSAL